MKRKVVRMERNGKESEWNEKGWKGKWLECKGMKKKVVRMYWDGKGSG